MYTVRFWNVLCMYVVRYFVTYYVYTYNTVPCCMGGRYLRLHYYNNTVPYCIEYCSLLYEILHILYLRLHYCNNTVPIFTSTLL